MHLVPISGRVMLLALFAGSLAILLPVTAALTPPWESDIVDNGSAFIGIGPSLALDSTGNPHIGFVDTDRHLLVYMVRGASGWYREEVAAGMTGDWCSIAFDNDDRPLLLTRDREESTLVLFSRSGPDIPVNRENETPTARDLSNTGSFNQGAGVGSIACSPWQKKSLYTRGYVADAPVDLVMDNDGYPHLACVLRGTFEICHLWKDTYGWHAETVGQSSGAWGPSLALDNRSRPRISYVQFLDPVQYRLVYAFRDEPGWQSELADTSPVAATGCSLVLDIKGTPSICYFDRHDGVLYYAERRASGWSREVVVSTGDPSSPASLCIDPAGRPCIMYLDRVSHALAFSWKDTSCWHTEQVTSSRSEWSCAFLMDSSGRSHAVYFDPSVAWLVSVNRPALPGGVRFTIRTTAGEGGAISPSGTIPVISGENSTLTIVPEDGYVTGQVVIDGDEVPIQATYHFPTVDQDHTLHAEFTPANGTPPVSIGEPTHSGSFDVGDSFVVNATASSGGSIRPSGTITVLAGSNLTFSLLPDPGHHAGTVLVDNREQEPARVLQLPNVSANHTIRVTFPENRYTLTASAGAGGSIRPAGIQKVGHGANQSYMITPSPGYRVIAVRVDGSGQPLQGGPSGESEILLQNITSDHEISAEFAPLVLSGLYIASNPPSAYVYCDGSLQGKTPLILTGLRDGDHEIRIVTTGFKDWQEVVRTKSGEAVTIDARLTPITSMTGRIYVLSLPEGAGIMLDGSETGRITPVMLNDVPAGSHTVRVEKTGYTPYVQTIDVRDSGITRVFGLLVRSRPD